MNSFRCSSVSESSYNTTILEPHTCSWSLLRKKPENHEPGLTVVTPIFPLSIYLPLCTGDLEMLSIAEQHVTTVCATWTTETLESKESPSLGCVAPAWPYLLPGWFIVQVFLICQILLCGQDRVAVKGVASPCCSVVVLLAMNHDKQLALFGEPSQANETITGMSHISHLK